MIERMVARARAGEITQEKALLGVSPAEIQQCMAPFFYVSELRRGESLLMGQGLGVYGRAAGGYVAFDADGVRLVFDSSRPVVLVCAFVTSAEREILPMLSGIVTRDGTRSCTAALAARRLGLTCVVGCDALTFSEGRVQGASFVLREGDPVSIDGNTGNVFAAELAFDVPQALPDDARTLLEWADEVSSMRVRSKVDTPYEMEMAIAMGARGVGLCRIECMMIEPARRPLFSDVLREAVRGERSALFDELERGLENDVFALLDLLASSGKGLPFLIRLLDAPLNQFLSEDECIEAREVSPMMGFRWCRLSIVIPSILDLQVRAILRAFKRIPGGAIRLQIMLPGVSDVGELREVKRRIEELSHEIFGVAAASVPFEVGSILELPRACLTADALAAEADFLSFGTNDLTQATYGFSRDDAHFSFLPAYIDRGIVADDPYLRLDRDGVGALMRIAVDRARSVRPDISIGMCGDQGADPESVALCQELQLDYVSCYPTHVPVARLGVAQAVLR